MSGQELVELYEQLFGTQPMRLTTVSIEEENYKKMIAYCNITGQPLNDAIITKFFHNNYDIVYPEKNSFSQFKKSK
jgi:NRPS condensation-like uncharacterized protein